MRRNSAHRKTGPRFEGVRAKKALGQHFLSDEDIAIEIVDSLLIPESGLDESPTVEGGVNVLEIGPGTGVLTKFLLMDKRINLQLCEIDTESIDKLRDRFPQFLYTLQPRDFLQTELEEREDVLQMFEGLLKHLFKAVKGIEFNEPFERITYDEAMNYFGSDKPDLRFGMQMHDITSTVQGHGFSVFDSAEYVGAIAVPGCAGYSRKQTDELTEWVKRPQVGAKGLVFIKLGDEVKSSIDKFYTPEQIQEIAAKCDANKGDLILILCGPKHKTQVALGTLRLEMGARLGLRKGDVFKPLWVTDFPLLEWDDETQRFYAMHHPFTSPKPEDLDKFFSNDKDGLAAVKANAYDIVLNGNEIGGGSIRIHDRKVQERMFEILGFTHEQAEYRFGFLMNAFKFGAPPHGGLAFGFDRLCALFGGQETIRDYIAFPKNNMGRDVMAEAPSVIDDAQMDELFLKSTYNKEANK